MKAFLVLLLIGSAARAAAPPKVVVTLVIDQLAAYIAQERWPLLPKEGGFARLRREGTWVRALVYDHAVTDTAPGHCALYTGAPPRETGVFANEIIDPKTREKVSVLRDEQTRLVAADGPRDKPGASLRILRGETLADRLRVERPKAPIASLSLKERSSLFGGGRAPTTTLWFDASLGRFVTSTAFPGGFPSWATSLLGADLVQRMHDRVWEVVDPAFAAHAATPDDQPGESDLSGYGRTFPHRLSAARDPARAFRASPFADEVLLDASLAAVDALRGTTPPMLLAISLSTNDYVGHLFGPDSVEAWDELRRLDTQLARFFAALDARLGADGWAVLIAGDHGTTTLPEAVSEKTRPWCKKKAPDPWERACGPAYRVVPDQWIPKLEAAAVRAVGEGRWVSGIADPYVYLTPAAHALPAERAQALRAALVAAMEAEPAVARVVDAQKIPERCASDASIDALLCRSLVSGAPGDYYVVLKPGSFFDPDYVIGYGTSHGSPYLYDRAVPLLVRAPGRIDAGKILAREPVGTFSRTAAGLLGIAPPAGATGGTDLSHPVRRK